VGYAPYGAPSHANAGAAPAFTYTGKPLDTATGLYHFPYRQYDPNASRWLTRDPLGMVDGPNVYAYVTGNPVGLVDPLGTFVTHIPDWIDLFRYWFCQAGCEAQHIILDGLNSVKCSVQRRMCALAPVGDRKNCLRRVEAFCAYRQCVADALYMQCSAGCSCKYLGVDCDECWQNDPRDCDHILHNYRE